MTARYPAVKQTSVGIRSYFHYITIMCWLLKSVFSEVTKLKKAKDIVWKYKGNMVHVPNNFNKDLDDNDAHV